MQNMTLEQFRATVESGGIHGEAFALWQGVGFVMLLVGIDLAARGERQ